MSVILGVVAGIAFLPSCILPFLAILGLLIAIGGVVAGHMARAEIRQTRATAGKEMAMGGLILSYVMAGCHFLLMLFFFSILVFAHSFSFGGKTFAQWIATNINEEVLKQGQVDNTPPIVSPPTQQSPPDAVPAPPPSGPSEPAPDAVTAQEVPNPSGENSDMAVPDRMILKYLMVFPRAKPLVLTPEEAETAVKADVWMEDGKIAFQPEGSTEVTRTSIDKLSDKGKRVILKGLKRVFGASEPEATQFQDAIRSLETPAPSP